MRARLVVCGLFVVLLGSSALSNPYDTYLTDPHAYDAYIKGLRAGIYMVSDGLAMVIDKGIVDMRVYEGISNLPLYMARHVDDRELADMVAFSFDWERDVFNELMEGLTTSRW